MGIIVHNCHNYAAKTFSQAFPKVQFKYTLGLSATPNRSDGLEKVFLWYLGPIIYESMERNINKLIVVNLLTYKIYNKEYTIELKNKMEKADIPNMVNNLCANMTRTKLILAKIKELVSDPKREILVISSRTIHLKYMHEQLENDPETSGLSGLYLGKTKEDEREETIKKRIILGIDKLCNEAFNVPIPAIEQ